MRSEGTSPNPEIEEYKRRSNNRPREAKVLLVAVPAGLEKFFEEAFYPVEDRLAAMPPMTGEFMARLLGAAAKCGLEFLPPAQQ